MNGPSRIRGDAEFGALLFVGALAPRLWLALAWAGEAVWDGHYYDFGARRIAAGFGYSDDRTIDGHAVWHAWCHYPVGYSGFLALFYRVLGASYATAAVANALVGAALALVTWALAKQALRPWRARAAGILVALHPGLIVYSALVMSEPLAALLTLLAFWLATRDDRPRRGLVFGALVLGLAALVRPQALLCAPFLALCFVGSPRGTATHGPRRWPRWAEAATAAVVACAVALVPVLPWTARNCSVMDGCALVSTNAGWNLAIGAFPRATGRFETLRSSDGCREVTGQVQQDRCWFAYGVQQIADHPWHWLGLVPAKLGYTFDHESFAVEYLHEAHPEAWPEPRRVFGRAVTTFAHRLLVMAAAFGAIAFPLIRRPLIRRPLVRRPRGASRAPFASSPAPVAAAVQGALIAIAGGLAVFAVTADAPTFWPLAVMATVVPWLPLPGAPERMPAVLLATSLLATTIATHAIFFGEDRYHIVVTPVLAILAASALRPPAVPRAAARVHDVETEPQVST